MKDMRNRERYKELCKKESTIPLFSQGWWLDAVCGENNWDVYIVGSNMDIKAAFTYFLQEDSEGKYIGRIMLTQNNVMKKKL